MTRIKRAASPPKTSLQGAFFNLSLRGACDEAILAQWSDCRALRARNDNVTRIAAAAAAPSPLKTSLRTYFDGIDSLMMEYMTTTCYRISLLYAQQSR